MTSLLLIFISQKKTNERSEKTLLSSLQKFASSLHSKVDKSYLGRQSPRPGSEEEGMKTKWVSRKLSSTAFLPSFSSRSLRTSYESGIWGEARSSPHMTKAIGGEMAKPSRRRTNRLKDLSSSRWMPFSRFKNRQLRVALKFLLRLSLHAFILFMVYF